MTGPKQTNRSAPDDLRQGTTDPQAVERWYDDWSSDYDRTLADWRYAAPEEAAERLAPHLGEDPRVLDVGCGTGLMAETLAPRGVRRIDGLDISGASLEIARGRGRYGALTRWNLQKAPLPVEAGAYDAAVCIGVLTYFDAPEALLRAIAAALRPGGVLAFTQREDRWDALDLPARLAGLSEDGVLEVLEVSEPRPYLPDNPEFGEEIGVRHVLCRKP
jgi:predicted TPR repeat methyltransferase